MNHEKLSKSEILILLTAGITFLFAIVFWANHNGALGIPRNDDAFYLRTAFHFANTGEFIPVSAYPMLYGQVLLSMPIIRVFGESILALQIYWTLIAVISILFLYVLLREFLSVLYATICVSVLAVSPIFANLSMSYMTDVPAFSFQVLAIFCFVKSLNVKHRSFAWFSAATISVALAFTIRQTSVTVIASILILLLVNHKKIVFAKKAILIFLPTCVGLGMFYFWRSGLANFTDFPVSFNNLRNPIKVIRDTFLSFGMTYGLYLFPLVSILNPKSIIRNFGRKGLLLSLIVGGVVSATIVAVRPKPSGNYFSQFVAYGASNNAAPNDVLNAWEWQLIQVLGLVSTVLFIVIVGRWCLLKREIRPTQRMSFKVVSTVLGVLVAFHAVSFGGVGMDRYGILAIPLLLSVFIKCAQDQRILVNKPLYLVLLPSALVLVWGIRAFDASTNYDGSNWKVAKQQVDAGSDPRTIDGGYSWFAFYQTDFDTTEVDKFDLWFKFRESPHLLSDAEKQITTNICYVTRQNVQGSNEQIVRELTVTGLFGWKTHAVLQKLDDCN